jgi:SAM-dependent methyltransferase
MKRRARGHTQSRFSLLSRIIASKAPERWSPDRYRAMLKESYNGPAGWFTVVSGFFTGHEMLAERIIGPRGFDVRGCKRVLDAGTGNGRYLRVLQKHVDPDAELVGCDLSIGMLRRAAQRLKNGKARLLTADVTRLPYKDGTFDAVVFGWVLEHLQDQIEGLKELARVLKPGGRVLLMTTEHTLLGAICSRVYLCRTTKRSDLKSLCAQAGLVWQRELYWTPLHRWSGAGGIVVELGKAR